MFLIAAIHSRTRLVAPAALLLTVVVFVIPR